MAMLFRIAKFAARWTLVFQKLKKSDTLVRLVYYLEGLSENWGLVQRFTFSSAIIILLGMTVNGWWVGEQIETGVIKEATSATALYMDSFIAPHVQELGRSDSITSPHIDSLNNLFSANNLGQRTVSVKIWNADHRIVYSNIPSLLGQKFPDTKDLVASWHGEVTGEISSLQEEENIEERNLSSDPLLEIYSPVRLNDTNQIIAVAEFYQKIDTLQTEIFAAQRRGWIVVGTTMFMIYLFLIGFIHLAGNKIGQQEQELKHQVLQLTRLLSRNKELARRIQLAAANTVALNEGFLRRTSAEIHDGPVQEISLALLRLDRAIEQNQMCGLPQSKCNDSLPKVQSSLQSALKEMRAIAADFGLPQLGELTMSEVITHVTRSHEQRTQTTVTLHMDDLPEQASLPIKIAVYRFIQEGLNNSYDHAGRKLQSVLVTYKADQMQIEVSDQGPGFTYDDSFFDSKDRLGLAGMRERVESLGGTFLIDESFKEGTKLIARLSLQNSGDNMYG